MVTVTAEGAERLLVEQTQFSGIYDAVGSLTVSFYVCCVLFDTPFLPEEIKAWDEGQEWVSYRKRIARRCKREVLDGGFFGSETDIRNAYGEGASREEFAEMLARERKEKPEAFDVGTPEQIRVWGRGGEQNPLTKEDYDRLDYFYETLTSRLENAGGVDAQQELILRKASELYREEEKLRKEGNVSDAQKCVKMALDLLSSEQLQKKDAKPAVPDEEVRIDAIVDALEKWGAVENGQLLSFDELTEFLLKELGRLGGTPAHQYTQTLDAADYELLFIRNCMAQNEDAPKWMELPDNMRFSEEVANEFAPEPSGDETRAYEGIGIVRNRPDEETLRKSQIGG